MRRRVLKKKREKKLVMLGWRTLAGSKKRRGLLSACKLLAPCQPRDSGICKLSEYCDPVLQLLINDS